MRFPRAEEIFINFYPQVRTAMESVIRRKLSQELTRVKEEIGDGINYGIPHVVGEILVGGDEPEVTLSVAVFENSRHSWVLREGGTILFMHPTEETNPHRLFFEIWSLLRGRKRNRGFSPGVRVKGILRNALHREGFEVLWMNVRQVGDLEYVDVWARKGGDRYNMLFQKIASGDYVLIEMEKV